MSVRGPSVAEFLGLGRGLGCRGQSQDDYAAPPQAAVVLDVERAHDFHLAKVAMEVGKNLEYAENDLVRTHGRRPPLSHPPPWTCPLRHLSSLERHACLLLRRLHAATSTVASNTSGLRDCKDDSQ